ncbi:MAG: hypothetical protein RDU30_04880 [Desulfovibrionaceae bacterium]|nr:hypothetical protein [Desulfovibrionaceae bacterium]
MGHGRYPPTGGAVRASLGLTGSPDGVGREATESGVDGVAEAASPLPG